MNYMSDQRNLQFKLQPEEELQLAKFLMEHTVDAVFWVDRDARFLYVNDAACSLVGYSRAELLSMTMHNLNLDFSVEVWSKHWRTLKQQGCLYFESLHQPKEGQSFPVEFALTYREYNGKECGCILVRDISKRKQTEVALQRVNEALKCKVQERTAQLRYVNEQLCREMAERRRAEAEVEKSLLLKQDAFQQWFAAQSQQRTTADTAIAATSQSIFPAYPHLTEVFHFIEANYHKSITLHDVAQVVGYSRSYLTQLVRRLTGKTVYRWIVERRIAEACSLLLETTDTVEQIAKAVGYQDTAHFFHQFRQLHGTTPQVWRKSQQTQYASRRGESA
jgi:PAS domain S-box-containing protein